MAEVPPKDLVTENPVDLLQQIMFHLLRLVQLVTKVTSCLLRPAVRLMSAEAYLAHVRQLTEENEELRVENNLQKVVLRQKNDQLGKAFRENIDLKMEIGKLTGKPLFPAEESGLFDVIVPTAPTLRNKN